VPRGSPTLRSWRGIDTGMCCAEVPSFAPGCVRRGSRIVRAPLLLLPQSLAKVVETRYIIPCWGKRLSRILQGHVPSPLCAPNSPV
jgi:hypothetical protein